MARNESIKHIFWQHIKLSTLKIPPCENQDGLLLIQHFWQFCTSLPWPFLCCQLITNWESEQFPALTLSQTQAPDNTHASAQLQCSRHTANIHGVHDSLKNENARGWIFFLITAKDFPDGLLNRVFSCLCSPAKLLAYKSSYTSKRNIITNQVNAQQRQ